MKKNIIIIFVLFFAFMSNSLALSYGGCNYQTVSRLKSLVSNVNISYNYHENNGQVYFDVTINNITPGMYLYDSNTSKNYYYSDTSSGELIIKNYTNSGSYKFYSDEEECKGIAIGTKFYKFPIYNYYYNDPLCSDIPNYSLCQKWVKNNVTYDTFVNLTNQYKSNLKLEESSEETVEYKKSFLDNLIEIYVNYYYYFFGAIIIIFGTIIVINQRKNRFKL